MPEINPYLKPFLRLLELAGVSFLIYLATDFLADQVADPEEMQPTGGDLADMNLFSPMVIMLGFFIFLLYFLFWHFRILQVIFTDKRWKVKLANIGLLLLLPATLAAGFGYISLKGYLARKTVEKFIVPVVFQTVFQTPHIIIGARLVNDSLFVFTWKYEVLDPDKKYKTANEALNSIAAEKRHLYGNVELHILHGEKWQKADWRRRGLNPDDLNFQRYDGCLIPFSPSQTWDVYRYNHCYYRKMETPALKGFSADFRGSQRCYQVNNDLFFATKPLRPNKEDSQKLFIGHITDALANVYTLDLSKNQSLAREFTGLDTYFKIFATNHTVYVVSRNRVLEVKL